VFDDDKRNTSDVTIGRVLTFGQHVTDINQRSYSLPRNILYPILNRKRLVPKGNATYSNYTYHPFSRMRDPLGRPLSVPYNGNVSKPFKNIGTITGLSAMVENSVLRKSTNSIQGDVLQRFLLQPRIHPSTWQNMLTDYHQT